MRGNSTGLGTWELPSCACPGRWRRLAEAPRCTPWWPSLLPLHLTRAGKQLLSLSPLDRTLNLPTCSSPHVPPSASCPMPDLRITRPFTSDGP